MRQSLNNHWTQRFRHGFTLVELLVAITILILISFLMVPLVTNLVAEMQNRGVTGATRTIQGTFGLARDQALRTAAPYGIRFVRDEDNPWLCRKIEFLQSPPVLSGKNLIKVEPSTGLRYQKVPGLQEPWQYNDDHDSAVNINTGEPILHLVDEDNEVYAVTGINPFWMGLVSRGDHIRINGGLRYEIVGPDVAPQDGLIDQIVGRHGSALSNDTDDPYGHGNYYRRSDGWYYPWIPDADGNYQETEMNRLTWTIFVAAETYPNRDGIGGSSESRGIALGAANQPAGVLSRYEIQRQPVAVADQDSVVLPPGVVIDLKRTRSLWNQIPSGGFLDGSDGMPGIAGVDDDLNGVVDGVNVNGIFIRDWGELGTPGSDDASPGSWPAMDILFSSTGEMTGPGAQAAVIHLWVGPQGLTDDAIQTAELAESRLVSIYTRTGFVQVNDINGTMDGDGVVNLYLYAEEGFGTQSAD